MSDCEPYHILMMGYLDGELSAEDTQRFKDHLTTCEECPAELVKYQNLHQVTAAIKLKEPTDFQWERFWSRYYNRLERRGGWVLLIIGLVLLLTYGIVELIRSPGTHVMLKVGAIAAGLGMTVLFVSVLRGRLETLKYDPYRGVRR